MKMIHFHGKGNGTRGKNNPSHGVNKSNQPGATSFSEVHMNINMIAALTAFGLGILVFLARRIINNLARQPILIETLRILYKRERR